MRDVQARPFIKLSICTSYRADIIAIKHGISVASKKDGTINSSVKVHEQKSWTGNVKISYHSIFLALVHHFFQVFSLAHRLHLYDAVFEFS
jgi:hypothetical protein